MNLIKKLGQRKIGTVLQYIMLLTNTLVGILFTPFMVHTLGSAEYGLYQLMSSFAGYLGVLDFGTATTLTRYISKFRSNGQKNEEENYLFMSLIQTLCFSLGVLLIGFSLFFFLDNIFCGSLSVNELGKAKLLYMMMVINISISLVDHYFWGTHLAGEKFIYNTSEKIIRIILRVVLITVLLKCGMDSVALIAVDLSLTVCMLICDAIYSFFKLNIKIKYHFTDKSLFKESFIFAFFIFLQAIVNQVTMNTDKVILGIMTSTTIVAIYAVAMQIFSIYNSLSTAIQSVFLPKATRLVHTGKTKEEITDFVIRPARIQFMILGIALVGFLLLGKEFVLNWMGEEYLSAYYIALIIMIPGTIELTENVMVSVVLAKNKNGFRTSVIAGVAVFNIITTVLFVKVFGYMGAPLATAISYLIGNILVMNIYYQRVIGINIGRFAKMVLQGTWLALAGTYGISFMVLRFISLSGLIGFITKAAIVVVIYFILMIVIGLNSEERRFLYSLKER